MSIPNASRRRNPLAALYLHLAVVGGFNAVTAQVPPPPQQQLLRETAGRTVPTTVITIAAIVLFLLVLFCVLVNQWRRSSSAGTDAARAGGWEASIRRRGRGLNPAAVAALPIVPYAEVKKHKSGGGGLECAVCLTAFSDGDELRLLPQCSHAFHPDCIDPWLEDHVTCPLCRANLEKTVPLPPPAVSLSSPETKPPQTLEAAVAVRVVEAENGDERREETVELERLRAATARMPRSRLTGHSTTTTVAAETAGGDHDHERFTVRLPPHVLEEVLKSRRLRHATSLIIRPGGGASNCEGSSACAVGRGERCHGTRRRWPSLLARTTSWAQSIAEGSSARTGGVGPDAGTRKTPCGHVVCSMVARWPARCKARNLA